MKESTSILNNSGKCDYCKEFAKPLQIGKYYNKEMNRYFPIYKKIAPNILELKCENSNCNNPYKRK